MNGVQKGQGCQVNVEWLRGRGVEEHSIVTNELGNYFANMAPHSWNHIFFHTIFFWYIRAELTPCRHENSKKVADVPQSPIFLFSTVLERSRHALSIHLHFVSIKIVRRKLFKENWILQFWAKIHKVDHMAAMIEASNL